MERGYISNKSIVYFIVPEMLGAFILCWILIGNYEQSKIFRPFIEDKLRKWGYTLISERPLKWSEALENYEFKIKPTITINGTPIENYKYKARSERMLHVKADDGEEFLIHAAIIKTWRNKIKLEIIKKSSAD